MAPNSEKLLEVVELAMDVSADGDRGLHHADVGLVDEDLFSLWQIVKLLCIVTFSARALISDSGSGDRKSVV